MNTFRCAVQISDWSIRLILQRLRLRNCTAIQILWLTSLQVIPEQSPANMQQDIQSPCRPIPIKFRDPNSSNWTIKISYRVPFNYKPRLIVHLSVVCDSLMAVGRRIGRAAFETDAILSKLPLKTSQPLLRLPEGSLPLPRSFRRDGASAGQEEKTSPRNTKKQGHLLISPNKDLI